MFGLGSSIFSFKLVSLATGGGPNMLYACPVANTWANLCVCDWMSMKRTGSVSIPRLVPLFGKFHGFVYFGK